MLVLEGILINVFETPKGVTKDGKEYGGESKIQVMYENTLAKRRKTHGDGDFDRCRYFPLPQQEKLACARSCGFKRVSGKGVFKGYKLTQGGEWAGASRPSPTCVKSAVFWRS